MAKEYVYHLYHGPAFDDLPPFTSAIIPTKALKDKVPPEEKPFFSLKNDLDELRKIGKTKGIVDDSVVSVGKSVEGKELMALKVGNGSDHKVLFAGCHHAREWISVEVPYLVAEYLIQNHSDDPKNDNERRIKHLLLNREIWFVPMVNPDGHDFTVKQNRHWRPNRNSYFLGPGTISRPASRGGDVTFTEKKYTGVDVNRNYPSSKWGQETFDNNGKPATSRNPQNSGENSTWCGVAPASEPETRVMEGLIRREGFKGSLTYHSYGQYLLYPEAAASDTFIQWVGEGMSDLIAGAGRPYTYGTIPELFYPVTGGMSEFTIEKFPGRSVFASELRPSGEDPESFAFSGLPENHIEPCFRENLPAALALINSAGQDAEAAPTQCDVTLSTDPVTCQVVQNSWEVFKGWTP
jgi:carboxypeptidase T